ncbi:hypothetical protein PARPLA_00808 [Rhodobacteraceae bacterium THAF1]|uniref:hypothetical protein n=1 Tax=Palleronia sp. THAF1 TaxID=2587842 RepID=UPI000F3BA783|nr:hypothetical protein [Palleronia sp. THAF1]QFU09632.1 hypothetical protein FIU81_13215 [Palleronia sp. THAF1]VDC17467.1 hypothetical protein PARPLA_00808 [Rhodobacteraceae bacterium THAF1]
MQTRSSLSDRKAKAAGFTGLRLVWGETYAPVRRFWKSGLALDAGTRAVPGLVHLYEGERHVATGLIVSDAVEGDEHRFHFKRITFCTDHAPLDYAVDDDVPARLLTSPDRVRPGL